MKQSLDKFIMGTCHLLERQGAFYLAFFVFNCLPMCCYMVMKKNGEATEDDVKILENKMQKLTDKQIEEIDKLAAAKKKEIMEI